MVFRCYIEAKEAIFKPIFMTALPTRAFRAVDFHSTVEFRPIIYSNEKSPQP